ncbi:hypothetical protein [Candidatus Villigracilis saccharophilus]|uniref:hypothetical protein n=1 Tax=Candidatus Villigracilis saccharophilus TaxID=3140684 RepID=UPI003134C9B9|nr:hypothetical protein [Anaerolineales bacterium]
MALVDSGEVPQAQVDEFKIVHDPFIGRVHAIIFGIKLDDMCPPAFITGSISFASRNSAAPVSSSLTDRSGTSFSSDEKLFSIRKLGGVGLILR